METSTSFHRLLPKSSSVFHRFPPYSITYISMRQYITLKQAVALGLTALQASQVFFTAGETFAADPSSFMLSCGARPPSDASLDVYFLFSPLDECGELASMFGPEAVHINSTDDITREQVQALHDVVAEFLSLWED